MTTRILSPRPMDARDDLQLFVCGGMGNLHPAMMPGMSNMITITRSLSADRWEGPGE